MPLRRLASPVAFAFAFLVFGALAAQAQTEIPGVGSWKLNVAKSRLGSEPPPQSVLSRIEAIDGHAHVVGVRIGADGIRTEARYKAKLDGKDYPIIGHPYADTIALKRIDDRTIERIDKKSGKVVEKSLTVFSSDGKSSTTTGKATNLRGDDFHYTVVNEKMP